MRRLITHSTIMMMIIILLSGCGIIKDIFAAGLWIGIIITVLILALVIFGLVKIIKKLK